VGRKKEIDVICKLAFSTTKKECPSKIVFVWGESGSGKSAFVVQAISNARKMLIFEKKAAVLTRNISSEGDSLVPFR
jgi:chromosomal replication initiation ATPase DnaA